MTRLAPYVAFAALLSSCIVNDIRDLRDDDGPPSSRKDAGMNDGGELPDATWSEEDGGTADGGLSPDASTEDAGESASDAGVGDAGEILDAGTVDAGGCQPNCTGRGCGDDGCGHSCGTCLGQQTCSAGICQPVPCPSGQHDGGDGVCVATGQCSVGFVLDRFGDCNPCAQTSECATGEFCVKGRCKMSNADCADCSQCSAGNCQKAPVPATNGTCFARIADAVCDSGGTVVCDLPFVGCVSRIHCWCEYSLCVMPCASAADCPSGYECNSFKNGANRCLPTSGYCSL